MSFSHPTGTPSESDFVPDPVLRARVRDLIIAFTDNPEKRRADPDVDYKGINRSDIETAKTVLHIIFQKIAIMPLDILRKFFDYFNDLDNSVGGGFDGFSRVGDDPFIKVVRIALIERLLQENPDVRDFISFDNIFALFVRSMSMDYSAEIEDILKSHSKINLLYPNNDFINVPNEERVKILTLMRMDLEAKLAQLSS